MNNLKKFSTEADYSAATLNYPAVSWVTATDNVYFDKEAPAQPLKWLATYSDSSTLSAECDSTSAITNGEISELTDVVSVEIGDCVTSIGDSVFEYCDSLTSCTIGNGVTSIGSNAFQFCDSLTSITVNAVTPPTLGTDVFNNTSSDLVIYVPSDSVSAYQSASGWSEYEDRIQAIPNS